MLQYRRLAKETRTAASVKFAEQYGREPDGVDEKDINKLLLIGKAYDRAMKQPIAKTLFICPVF